MSESLRDIYENGCAVTLQMITILLRCDAVTIKYYPTKSDTEIPHF